MVDVFASVPSRDFRSRAQANCQLNMSDTGSFTGYRGSTSFIFRRSRRVRSCSQFHTCCSSASHWPSLLRTKSYRCPDGRVRCRRSTTAATSMSGGRSTCITGSWRRRMIHRRSLWCFGSTEALAARHWMVSFMSTARSVPTLPIRRNSSVSSRRGPSLRTWSISRRRPAWASATQTTPPTTARTTIRRLKTISRRWRPSFQSSQL